MAVSFAFEPVTERFRRELRAWGLEMVRPHERAVDRSHTYPDNLADILAACPVSVSPLLLTELRNDELGNDKEFVASFGDEGSNVLAAIMSEEFSYAGLWASTLLRSRGAGDKVVPLLGTPEQVERWVTGKNLRGSFALTEPHFGSDASAVATTATRDGDEWVINGTKSFISNGAHADYVVVFATIDKSLGREGIRAFIVERGAPGFVVARQTEEKMGYRHTATSELVFDDARVPLDNILGGVDGKPGKGGFLGALQSLAVTRPIFAAQAVGIGRAAIDVAAEWARDNRAEFTPHRFARVEDEVRRLNHALDEASRVVIYAAWLRDAGRDNRVASSMSKALAPVAGEAACRRAVEIMGSAGASEQWLVEKWLRDVRVYDIYEGSGQIQRITVSRRILGAGASRA